MIVVKLQRKRNLSEEQINQLQYLFQQGHTVASIADELFGVKRKVIYYWTARLDISPWKYKLKTETFKTQKQGKPYFYYVKQAMDRGDMNKRVARKALNTFYQNKDKVYL